MEINLLKQLSALWVKSRRDLNEKWKRTLPFGDYVVDRWEKAKDLGFGEGAACYDRVVIIVDLKVG